MMQILKTVLSMSLSGALLILLLHFGGVILKNRISRQWQYYIWLIVLLRLLIPFGPEASLMGRAYQAVGGMTTQMTQGTYLPVQSSGQGVWQESGHSAVQGSEYSSEQNAVQDLRQSSAQRNPQADSEKPVTENEAAANLSDTASRPVNTDVGNGFSRSEGMALAGKYLWMIWLAVALGMLVRKVSMYWNYIRYVRTGAEPVSDAALLDRLAEMAQGMGIGRAIELCVNPHVASPMLVGYFHPCIVLPYADVREDRFCYMAVHELTHYKRRDILYKWLVQLTVCLHWFNPFVYLMRREMERACEFSCDEAVVLKMGYGHAADYGETLLDAMAAAVTSREPFAAVSMSANKELLRERLGAIMSCKKKTKRAGWITTGLTVCIALGAFFLGVYPIAASEPESAETGALSVADKAMGADYDSRTLVREPSRDAAEKEIPVQEKPAGASGEAAADAEKYYKAHSLPQFYIAFCKLNETEQGAWLYRIYADGTTPFFSASVLALDADSPLLQSFAEKCYGDGSIAFFSILAEGMDEETLEGWLDRALADQKLNFQSMLYDKLDREAEWDEVKKALEEEQLAQYRAVGVTKNGKNYYYQGQLVNIFLDIRRPNRSFYTLDMNPAGTVNVKIIRAEDGQATGATYMTEAEIEELFGDREEDEEAETDEEVNFE